MPNFSYIVRRLEFIFNYILSNPFFQNNISFTFNYTTKKGISFNTNS